MKPNIKEFNLYRRHHFFYETILESFKSSYKHPLGAIVVNRGKIVGRGFNTVNYVGGRAYLNGIHAEISAINNTDPNKRKNSTLYIARRKRSGGLGCAKPCPACEK